MADLTDLDGIGPSTAEDFEESGYETVADVADADPDALADVASHLSEDKALEVIVQAQDLASEGEPEPDDKGEEEFDLTPAEVSEETDEEIEQELEDLEEEIEEDLEADEDDVGEEPEDDGPDTHTVTINFENRLQFDTYHAALMRHHERHYTGNQPTANALQKALGGLDNFDSVEYEFTEEELNAIHSGVLQTKTHYQGDNLIDHMDELQVVLDQINEQRREYLF